MGLYSGQHLMTEGSTSTARRTAPPGDPAEPASQATRRAGAHRVRAHARSSSNRSQRGRHRARHAARPHETPVIGCARHGARASSCRLVRRAAQRRPRVRRLARSRPSGARRAGRDRHPAPRRGRSPSAPTSPSRSTRASSSRCSAPRNTFWDTFARWDSGWYVGIARDGYKFAEGGRSNLAFFPAYPLSMRYTGVPPGRPHRALLPRRHPRLVGRRSSARWCCSTASRGSTWTRRRPMRAVIYAADRSRRRFFFGLVYSESLFLCLMLGTVYAIRTKQWAVAGVVGALAMCSPRERDHGDAGAGVAGVARGRPGPRAARLGGARADRHRRWASSRGAATSTCSAATRSSGRPASSAGTTTRAARRRGRRSFGLLEALWVRPYHYLTTEHQALYDTLQRAAGHRGRRCRRRSSGGGWAPATACSWLANLALPLSAGQFEGLARYCSVLFPFAIGLAAAVRSADAAATWCWPPSRRCSCWGCRCS